MSAAILPVSQVNCLSEYFRCPDQYSRVAMLGTPADKCGYFRFGDEIVYGRCSGLTPADCPRDAADNALAAARLESGTVFLPFDVDRVIDNLRKELYSDWWSNETQKSLVASLYYLVRPVLPVGVRKHLQSFRLRKWEEIPFPHWPVDLTVDNVLEQIMLLAMRAQNLEHVPFIWFWPDGASGGALVTHDVETAAGVSSCEMLMDINDSFNIKASFQIVPEERYHVTPAFLDSLRNRGFEIAVHDLNHDGHLFRDRDQFAERVAKINAYGQLFGTRGFRAGVLYRNQLWYDLLKFDYDMSVPNVAHLDPQRGGCCTVMPYFVGDVLELPVTITQDYPLFYILKDYSINLWKQQIALITEKHGLVSAVVHPDYLTGERERKVYKDLLKHLSDLRTDQQLWITTPGEVNRWWRQRAAMTIVERSGHFEIAGPGKERARIAYATERDGRLVFDLQPAFA